MLQSKQGYKDLCPCLTEVQATNTDGIMIQYHAPNVLALVHS